MTIFGKKTTNRNLIVLDIGSQFLKVLFLEIDKEEEKGILRSWVREPLYKVSNEERTVIELEKIHPLCQKAINKVEKKANLKAGRVFIGIGGEVIKGTSTTFCHRRERPTQKIDLAELKYLVQKVQWKAFEKIRKIFALETGLLETEAKLVNAHIINIKIDGNNVANPLGFQGGNLCLSIFNSYTSVKYLETLVKLASQLGLELTGIDSPSYALFHCFDLGNLSGEDALIIDVGGKITEVVLIKNEGEVVETRSFNLGGQVFTRTISDFLELGLDEAESIKVKYSKGGVGSEAKKKLGKLLRPNISSWLGGVRIVLDEFFRKYKSLPKKIFFCGEGSNLPEIKETLKKKGDFKIKLILPHEISKIENKTKLEEIPCLSLAALALESPETSEFSSTLKRVVRLIQD